ncbi:SUKH-4 family immunity protein [Dactylosporangium sucinum]|uniref:SUKH-4 family immunity protein n=1 Tax=Dactylosporangium sucinum TaxID=1424081 RepID=UPI00167E67DB|nr:SUKH-4 family immunity protein [Dactylosporangium sucinum]
MAANDLPSAPDFASLSAWAGAGRVIRAEASDVAGWRLPRAQKAALTSCGVPLLDDIVDMTLFAAQPQDGTYRLAGTRGDLHWPGYTYVAEPDSGLVSVLEPSTRLVRFVNSSINHWLCSLHLVGTWFSSSTAIQTWDEDEAMEGVVLAELADLLQRIRHLDPHAYGDVGDHETHFWPAVLDRWLY